MKDWAFNRQRYWGEPIPVIHCEDCGMVHVPEEDLPVMLPVVEDFAPGDDGQSPLANIPDFVNTTCPKCAKKYLFKSRRYFETRVKGRTRPFTRV